MRLFRVAVILLSILLTCGAVAAEPLSLKPGDTLQTVLAGQQGKRVAVRLQGGEELTGKLTFVSGDLVQLEGLTGRDFYDAVIPLARIEAVVVRTRDK